MYIRRRNYEHGRIKRNTRKSKTFEAFNSIFGTYFKLLLIWATVLMLDFFTDFRFEFIYSCWLFVRTVVDSFRYQGLAFALFFTLIALTSDLICYFLVPTALIYLLGSSFVWVQLVWQADRGVYGPTMVFCFLFVYVEVAVRLRDPKSLPLSIDLCRPFAAHCIGYPAVTLGFGLKTMVAHHLRLRRQRSVEAQNMTFFALLEEALPKEFRYYFKPDLPTKSKRGSPITSTTSCPALTAPNSVTSSRTNGVVVSPSDRIHSNTTAASNSRKHTHNNSAVSVTNTSPRLDPITDSADSVAVLETADCESSSRSDLFAVGRIRSGHRSNPDFLQQSELDGSENDRFTKAPSLLSAAVTTSTPWTPTSTTASAISTTSDLLENESYLPDSNQSRAASGNKPTAHSKAPSSICSTSSSGSSASSSSSLSLSNGPLPSNSAGPSSCPTSRNTTTVGRTGGGSSGSVTSNSTSKAGATGAGGAGGHKPNPAGCKNPQKDEYTLKLETELRQLKSELQSLRALEIDLRTQVQQLTAAERTYRSESAQARQESESLQTKLNQLTQRLQADRANLQAAEKRLAEERKQRSALEQQIAAQQQQQQAQGHSRSSGKGRRDATEDSTPQVSGTSTKNQGTNVSRGTSTAPSSFVGACLGGDSCASRVQELEAELHALTRDLSAKDMQLAALKDGRASTSSLSLNGPSGPAVSSTDQQQRVPGQKAGDTTKVSESEACNPPSHSRGHHPETAAISKANKELMTRLTSLQEENQRLADTLKEEDKMKQELMTAYHSSLKEITELNATLTKKEYQIVELNMRMDYLTPHLCDYMHMLNGPMSGSDSSIPASAHLGASSFGGKLSRNAAASDSMSGDGTLYTAPYLADLRPSSNTMGKVGPQKPGANEDVLSYIDLRLSQFAPNGPVQSSQSNPNYLSSVSACNNQSNYVSGTLDGGLRGLCQTTSSGTFSSSDYATARMNNLPGIQPLIGSVVYSRPESNQCYGGQQQSVVQMRPSRNNASSLNAATTNTSQYDVASNAQPNSLHLSYPSAAAMSHHSLLNRYKSSSSSSSVNRMQSSCVYPMSGGRPLPVGSSASPTSPPPFAAPPPGLYNMSNSANSNTQLNGGPGLFNPSSTVSPGSMGPMDLQPIFASPSSTPLEVVVHSDGHQIPSGYLHSPNEPNMLSRSPGPSATALSTCLMDSLSPLTSNTGSQFFSAKHPLDMRDRSFVHVLSEVTSTVSGNQLLGPLPGDHNRPRSNATCAQSFNGPTAGNFLPNTFDASELANTGATVTGFLPGEPHALTSSFEHSVPSVSSSSSEARASSLDPERERSNQLELDTVLTGNKPAPPS